MSNDTWQLQDAKARLSELIDKAESEGPQMVTRRGKETVVVVSVATWRDMEKRAKPAYTIKDWLLEPGARTEELTPKRMKLRLRPPPVFD